MRVPPPRPGPMPARDGGPYPDPRSAFALTFLAVIATALVGVFFFGLGPLAAVGIGQAIAVGTIASQAARRVAEPQAERIGLRAFEPGALPVLLCLTPAVLLASELDNWASDWSRVEPSGTAAVESTLDATGEEAPAISEETDADPEAAPILDPDDPWAVAQAFVIYVGIAPVVEEFFFRGVLQQSLVLRLGLLRGVAFVALLSSLFHLPATLDLLRFGFGLVSAFGMGCLLGLARVATGSILGSIVLASSWAAVGIASFALEDRLPLPGLNVDGTHLPVLVALGSAALVAWAAHTIHREAEKRFEEEGLGASGGRLEPSGGAGD